MQGWDPKYPHSEIISLKVNNKHKLIIKMHDKKLKAWKQIKKQDKLYWKGYKLTCWMQCLAMINVSL